MAERIRMGLVGPGFIAQHHIDAVDVLVMSMSSRLPGQRSLPHNAKLKSLKSTEATEASKSLVNDPTIQVVHTPRLTTCNVPPSRWPQYAPESM